MLNENEMRIALGQRQRTKIDKYQALYCHHFQQHPRQTLGEEGGDHMPTTFVRSPDACRSPLCEGIHQSTDFEPNLKLSLATECLVNPAETNYQDIKQGKGGWVVCSG